MKKHITTFSLTDKVRIDVAGCGGTGSQMLVALARINHALVTLGGQGLVVRCYDPDVVSAANCGRQAFYEVDLGHNKAEVLSSRLRLCFPDFSVTGLAAAYNPMSGGYPYHYPHILISCVDSRKARRDIISKRNSVYHIDCGNGENYGQVILGAGTQELPWPEEAEPDLVAEGPEDDTPSCSMEEALSRQDLFVNDFAVRICSCLLWDLLRYGGTDIAGAFYSTNPVRVNPVLIEKE